MARIEDLNQDAGSPDNKLTTVTLTYENPNEINGFVVLGETEPASQSGCTHVSKAIDATSVKKHIQRDGGFSSLKCSNCSKNQAFEECEEKDLSLCLKCGACNCDDHLSKHFEIIHSDLHTLYVKINNWTVWCSKCNIEIPVETSGKLKEGINLLKQQQLRSQKNHPRLPSSVEADPIAVGMDPSFHFGRNANLSSSALSVNVVRKDGPLPTKSSSQLPSPRGLINLGNTCFMNSVLQCLAQTPFLLEVLMEIAEPGEKATLNISENDQMIVELDKWGPLTETLAYTLSEMTRDASGVFSPNQLLDALRKKCRSFIGYNQHDAHELLRQLLDSVKTEDIRRYQSHILSHLGLSKKSHPDEVDEKKRALAKRVNQKLTEMVNIRPDQVFKGTLVSTVQCTKCYHKSEVVESFLDLSLPVSFEKAQPSILARRKNVFNDDEPRSKSNHQKKKEKKAARKAKKLAKFKKRLKDEENKEVKSTECEKKDVNESGYSSAKAVSPVQINNLQASVENNRNEILAEALTEINSSSSPSPIYNINSINDETITKPSQNDDATKALPTDEPKDTVQAFIGSCASLTSPEKLNTANETNVSPVIYPVVNYVEDDNISETDQFISDVPDMRCRLVNSPAAPGDASSSTSGGSSEDKDDDDNDLDDEDAADGDDDGSADDDDADDCMSEEERVNATLQSPGKYDDGSILSCLAQFTAPEILTGNNKVKCDSCTNAHNKDVGENENKKPVYQPATKQLLINSPPPILILHLKRFQAMFTSLRKVSKPVDFPLILDIGPFCSAKCQNLLVPGQKKILYSLYGIVVHSGSLQGGHYIAYVKVRKPVEKDSYRRLFLPKNSNNSLQLENLNLENLERKIEEDQNSSGGTWYCISDSNVSRVMSDEQVLKKEAYLLFYERIF